METINCATRIYAVLGDPVAQVQTPRLANPLFSAVGANVVAVPFHVTAAMLDATWKTFRALQNIAGIGVTVPHKIAAAQLCDTLTPVAQAVGAVNSIQRSPDGRMHGALFDGEGFVQSIGASRLTDRRVLLVGAGGAGRAIAHALTLAGIAKLTVFDRDHVAVQKTIEMVTPLAALQVQAGPPEIGDHDVVINATPMGLKPSDLLPVDLGQVSRTVLIADIAALNHETALIAKARALGCVNTDGNDMLSGQIRLIAGFATGLAAGTPLRTRQVSHL